MQLKTSRSVRAVVGIGVVMLIAAACSKGGSSTTGTTSGATSGTTSGATSGTTSGATSGGGQIPAGITTDSFTLDIATTMAKFKALVAAATKGANSLQIGVILPDTTSSTRYVDFDAPYLKQAFTAAGYTSSQFKIDNAQGSDQTMLSDATADINQGAKVLIVDPIDGPTGVAVARLAASKGVQLIAYDRAIFQGTNTYYVSFDNEGVGELMGQGFMDCVTSWGISNPKVFVLNGGEDTDPNAISFAEGYNKAVWGQEAKDVAAGATNDKGYTLVDENFAPGWDNTKGGTIFQQAFTANPDINATIEANDGLANSVITVLKSSGVKAKSVPTTGQDATAQGMAWILQDYQCGSVYKPPYLEPQVSVALGTILLSGLTPPAALVNGITVDPANSSSKEPASLLKPIWVTKSNMEDTVVKDGVDSAKDICAIAGAQVCAANGIK
ncbi:MAG TPA: substrate-binding domain-containing protein [Actinomycetota bacterium]|jgi:D-xylose transport system substrate-binding protein